MAMRSGRRAGEEVRVSLRDFVWPRELIATLRHSTLPFIAETTLHGVPITVQLGSRDRLSLLAQFAAHQSFLQFAGVADGELDPNEWVVEQKRGCDSRLVRVAARAADETPPMLTLAQQFAEAIGAPKLDVMRQSWARAESVFVECWSRLRADASADLRWARRSAGGTILSPGGEAIVRGARHVYTEESIVEAMRALAVLDPSMRVVTIRGGSIIRYGALEELRPIAGDNFDPARVAALVESHHVVFVLVAPESLDSASKRVVQMLSTIDGATWLAPGDVPTLPRARTFIVASHLAQARAVEEKPELLERILESLDSFLDRGEMPAAEVVLAEPMRSYIGALALLGDRIPRETAAKFLRELSFDGDLDQLVVDDLTSLDDESFRILRPVPMLASREAIARVAASAAEEAGDLARAGVLLIDAGDLKRGQELLERMAWRDCDEIIATLRPLRTLTTGLAKTLANALIDAGRYRDARDVAVMVEDHELLLARIERRTGDYKPALARLERLPRSGANDALRAEILHVERRNAEALTLLATAEAHPGVAYLRALIDGADDADTSAYLRARLKTYRSLEREDFDRAMQHIEAALRESTTVAERIDAQLDRVYTLFAAGRWSDARHAALEMLASVEETQGDRAAGGLLFLLAFLCADEGEEAHAAQRINRLRHFYSGTEDERHFAEIDLLSARLDLTRGRFDAALRAAKSLLARSHDAPIVEAAAMIADAIDFFEKRPVATRDEPRNVELRRRHHYLRGSGTLPDDHPLKRLKSIDVKPANDDVNFLRVASTRAFPFAPHDFDAAWRYATRNRLGHWNEIGHDTDGESADWIVFTDSERLFIERSHAWSVESREAIVAVFRTRAELHRLRRIVEQEETAERPRIAANSGIIGESAALLEVTSRIALIAKRDVAVCVLGESGTGKELVARAIHVHSSRKHKTFTPVNCAALPETLIESELFGHMRGAFTGADRDRAGLIESADGGTLFLDEIGEMPLAAQAKLLRFLQEGEFRRVGDTVNRTADVRIVSATNRKLESAVDEGRFREDLYYRIRGVEITLPPLRERGNDIVLLASHFLARERERHRGGPSRLSPDCESLFLGYAWPGNVRELQNTIRAAHAIASEAKEIAVEHLPERVRKAAPSRTIAGSYQDAVMRFRRDLIESALLQADGNQNRAAAMLKISRQALGYQIRELGIMVRRTNL
jgi:DNA-binding NtrC family response regulator/tetratricopeptide (TPR) repeat protein